MTKYRNINIPAFNKAGKGKVGWCFATDTLVLKANGEYTPIQELKVGDKVYNKDGSRINTIVKTMSRKADTVKLKVASHGPVVVTPEHPFYVSTRTISGFTKKEFKTRTRDYGWLEPEYRETKGLQSTYGREDHIILPKVQCKESGLTKDELIYLGYWLGDGSKTFSKSKDKTKYINHAKISIYGGDTKKAFVEGLDIYQRYSRYDYSSCNTWYLSNKKHKKLSDIIKTIPLKDKRFLPLIFADWEYEYIIKGYLRADGSMTKRGSYKAENYKSVTISKALAYSLQMAGNIAGWQVSVNPRKQNTEQIILGRKVNCHPVVYYQSWSKKEDLHKRLIKTKTAFNQDWCKVDSVEPYKEVEVFNISTDGDNSYIADNLGCHNCLNYVDNAISAKDRSATAQQAMDKQHLHFPEELPENVFVSYWWSSKSGNGHVAICKRMGDFTETWSSNSTSQLGANNSWSFEDEERFAKNTGLIRRGWSATCDGVRIAEAIIDPTPSGWSKMDNPRNGATIKKNIPTEKGDVIFCASIEDGKPVTKFLYWNDKDWK